MKSVYTWFKYRGVYGGGYESWRYAHVPSCVTYMSKKKWLEEILEGNGSLNTESEQYRGVEIVPVCRAPIDVIQSQIKDLEESISYKAEKLEWLKREEKKVLKGNRRNEKNNRNRRG